MAAETSDNMLAPSVTFTPIANRTRSKVGSLAKKLSDSHLRTSTKSTGKPIDESELEDELGDELKDDGDNDDNDSPVVSKSPGPEEARNEKTKDEQIVNTALVSFLSALTLHAGFPNRWTLHRKSFKASFENASFEARTDGYLESKASYGKVQALIEVKAVSRVKKRKEICMQEGAQMAAWILSHPDENGKLNLPGRRLHIIQDRDEIYIVFAEYSTDYINYLRNLPAPDAYMTMHEFGPWETMELKSVKNLAVILVAIVLRASSDSNGL